jgi:transposase
VPGERHLCVFVHEVVERLDLSAFEQDYEEEGRPAYAPALRVKVWRYAYALGITSCRRLEQRVREDLGFRYLAGEAQPDFWTLNAFRQRHPKALNDLFTQVVERAREAGLGRLGHVAIDSTRVKANASRDGVDSVKKLRAERAKIRHQIRRWQRACNAEDPNEAPGLERASQEGERLPQKLAEIPPRLEELKKSGLERYSRTDPDSRFLKTRQGFVLGSTVTLAASEDPLIVEPRVTQEPTAGAALLLRVEGVKQRCGETPPQVSVLKACPDTTPRCPPKDGDTFSWRRGVASAPEPTLTPELQAAERLRAPGRSEPGQGCRLIRMPLSRISRNDTRPADC